jgi:hypothetical protein
MPAVSIRFAMKYVAGLMFTELPGTPTFAFLGRPFAIASALRQRVQRRLYGFRVHVLCVGMVGGVAHAAGGILENIGKVLIFETASGCRHGVDGSLDVVQHILEIHRFGSGLGCRLKRSSNPSLSHIWNSIKAADKSM